MKERLFRALNIKYSESGQVFDLLSVQFLIGLANALINIIAFSLFIYNFQIHFLPQVYLVIAGGLILLNIIYEKLEHRFSPVLLLRSVIGFAIVLLVILWVGLSFGQKNDFIFALLVSSVLIYMVTGYAFWGLVSLLFNVRESRRLFSIVGSGDIPAKLIGYLAGPLLIPVVGLNNLLWLAIAALCGSFILFSIYIRKASWKHLQHHGHSDHHHEEEPLLKNAGFVGFFFKNKLIFAISLLSLLSYNVFVLVDYTFISQVKLKFENITDLAAYIAIFFAFGRLAAMAFKLIFTSRLIEKLGVIYCLFITPVALFIFSLIFIIYGGHPEYNVFIFGLMAMLVEVLRSTMQEPVFFILFQPLKEKLRLKGHLISKGYMYPPSLIVVGLSLLFIYRSGEEMSILFAVKILLVNLCIWVAIIFFIRKSYLHTIRESIRKGMFSSEDIFIRDQDSIEMLLRKANNGSKIESIYALNLLEKSGYAALPTLLQDILVSHPDTEVKSYVLDRMEGAGDLDLGLLKNMSAQQPAPALQQKLVSILCKHDPVYLKTVSDQLESTDNSLKKIIIIHLLNQREFSYLLKAGEALDGLLKSSQHTERELAVEIISELKHVQFSEAIERLIRDEEPSVKRQAIAAACKLRMHALLPSIIDQLYTPEHKNIALQGLQIYGDSVFEDIARYPQIDTTTIKQDLIKIASRIKGDHSTGFLLAHISNEKALNNDKIVHALWLKEYEPESTAGTEQFNTLLRTYLANAQEKLGDYFQVANDSSNTLISKSVYNEIRADLGSILKLCSLLYRKKEINRVIELMELEKQDKIYNAMEMMELVLPKKIAKEINALFDFILDPSSHPFSTDKKNIREFYDKAIFTKPVKYNAWTRSVCVYSSWKSHDEEILQKLQQANMAHEHFLLTETRNHAIRSIN